jgi:DNA replication and repair protein RecF
MARRDGSTGWTVAANLHGADGDIQIGVGIDPGGDARRLRIDGASEKGFEKLARMIPQLWLTPLMDRLFVDAAAGRRRFLDRFAQGLAPNHSRTLLAYEKAMRERNRLLQDGQAAASWLDSLETTMAVEGVAIADARLQALDALANGLTQGHHPHFPQAEIALEGRLEAALRAQSAVEAEDEFRAHLQAARGLDAAAGRTLDGPHRSDFVVRHLEKDMPAASCSTGEQKALLVGLILAQARVLTRETGIVPLLLLDEVAAHLDSRRRAALFEVILQLGTQAWITGTDAAVFSEFNVTHVQIINGEITPRRGA